MTAMSDSQEVQSLQVGSGSGNSGAPLNQEPYVDDELPLPSFNDIFGDGFSAFKSNKKKRKNNKDNEELTG